MPKRPSIRNSSIKSGDIIATNNDKLLLEKKSVVQYKQVIKLKNWQLKKPKRVTSRKKNKNMNSKMIWFIAIISSAFFVV